MSEERALDLVSEANVSAAQRSVSNKKIVNNKKNVTKKVSKYCCFNRAKRAYIAKNCEYILE
jgi:hypothetical protein